MSVKDPTDVDIIIGKNIKRIRGDIGLTQQDIAESIGVRWQQVQKYESGKNRISASRLMTLSNAVGVSITEFFKEKGI